jgi:hypothetical protein
MSTVRDIAYNIIQAASRMNFRAFKPSDRELPTEVETPAETSRDAAHFVFTTDGDLIPCDEYGHLLAELAEEPPLPATSEHKTPAA